MKDNTKTSNGAKSITPAEIPDLIAKNAKAQQQAVSKRDEERLKRLLRGDEEPPNEFAKYIIDQLKKLRDAGDALDHQLEQSRQQVAALEKEQIRLSGIADQYLLDLKKWTQPPEQKAEDAAQQKGKEDEIPDSVEKA